MGRIHTWIMLVAGILLILATLALHIATYYGLALTKRWPSYCAVFPLGLLAFAVVLSGAQTRTKVRGKVPMFTAFEPSSHCLAELVAGMVLLYAGMVLALGFMRPGEGHPTRIEGRPVIRKHGQVLRQLGEQEYAHLKTFEIRGISAIFLFFVTADALELAPIVLLEERKHTTRSALQTPLA